MKLTSLKLPNVILGKLLVELVFISVLAVGFYSVAFPPTFHGWGEVVQASSSISGWAVNNSSPWERVQVQLFIDGDFVATQVAAVSRPDVAKAGWARDEWHGYQFKLEKFAQGAHEARVYALHPSGKGTRFTLQLLGDPVYFEVDHNGRLTPRKN